MTLTEAQIQFAAEFVTLVVTASALALLLLRPQRRFDHSGRDVLSRPPRVQSLLAGTALAVLAGAAFVHGSVLVSGHRVEWIGLGRLVASVVGLLAFPYPGGPRTGRTPVGGLLLRVGFLSWLAAGAVELGSGREYAADALLAAGALLTGGALLRVARRSIAVRVGASGAASLLLVVVVLALSLSEVISSKIQHEELSRLSARSGVEKAAMTDTTAVSADAQYVEAYLSASFQQAMATTLTDFATGGAGAKASAASLILTHLNTLPARPGVLTVAYADPTGKSVLVPGQTLPTSSSGFSQEPDLRPSGCKAGRQGLFQIATSAWLAASTPECTTTGTLLGVVIVAEPLDRAYLARRQGIDPNVALALVSGRSVVAEAGTTPAVAETIAAHSPAPPGQSVARVLGDQFVSVVGLTSGGNGQAPLYLVVTERTNTVLSTRDQLFRTLFLIAFGGTVLALGLAIFTGDRITAGLRRLTRAAAGIAAGDSNVRAGVAGDDEVASLGTAFDAMLDSVLAQSAALQTAAGDEARLRNRLEAVVAGMSDALIAVDVYGQVTDFNQAAVDLTGVDAATALGAPAARVVRVSNEDGAAITRQLLKPGGRTMAMMAKVVRDDGEIPVAVSSGALRGPAGEAVGTVLVFRDMRREQEVEQMKTEFLSRIGHELRTPLTGILGYADILLRREVTEERARSWHEEILHSARRLLRIVEMLEFFASEGAGRVVLRPEPIDIRALVNGIASSWSARIPPNLSLGKRLPKGATVVRADQRWLTLAVDELIDNAVKFSPEGGRILIKVTANRETRDAPANVEISVSDQGMGMTAQHYDVIFGEFVQGDNSDTRRFGGLGLGLAVVRRVVEGLGGDISCRSAPGRGTTFVIGLPMSAEVPANGVVATRPGRTGRVGRPSRAGRSGVSKSSGVPKSTGVSKNGAKGAAADGGRGRGRARPSPTRRGDGS